MSDKKIVFVLAQLLIFFKMMTLFSHPCFANDDPLLKTACELCLSGDGDEGFVASRVLLKRYCEDAAMTLFLRERMTLCLVEDKLLNEAVDNADYVIDHSKEPLFIGAAWYQKSEQALARKDYKDVLTYTGIAINALEKTNPMATDWHSYRDAFLYFSHKQREIAYEQLGDAANAAEEKKCAEYLQHTLKGQIK